MRNKIISLYFGLTKQDGERVENEDFNSFCYKVVSKVYDSYTIQQGIGVWKGQFEECRVVTIVVDHSASLTRIGDICHTYCLQFDQESVLCMISEGDAIMYESSVKQWMQEGK